MSVVVAGGDGSGVVMVVVYGLQCVCTLTVISYFGYFTINGVCSLPVTSDVTMNSVCSLAATCDIGYSTMNGVCSLAVTSGVGYFT